MPRNSPRTCLALGTAYLANGDFDAAIRSLNELLTSLPDTADAYFQLGNAYLKLGTPRMAVQSYRQALRVDPQNEVARLGWRRVYFRRKRRRGRNSPSEYAVQSNPMILRDTICLATPTVI